MEKIKYRVVPITLDIANEFISRFHRHHKRVVGHRFSLGVRDEEFNLRGIAVVGRPVGRNVPQYMVAEVTRLTTDGSFNACSKLYSACARACKEMGYSYIQTYILDIEPGTSLLASGWTSEGAAGGGNWNCNARTGRRTDQPMGKKIRWIKKLN